MKALESAELGLRLRPLAELHIGHAEFAMGTHHLAVGLDRAFIMFPGGGEVA